MDGVAVVALVTWAQAHSQVPMWALDLRPHLSAVSPVGAVCFSWAAVGHKLHTASDTATLLFSRGLCPTCLLPEAFIWSLVLGSGLALLRTHGA